MEAFSPLFKHTYALKQCNDNLTISFYETDKTAHNIYVVPFSKLENSRVRCRKFKLYIVYKSVVKIVYDLTVQITDAFSFRYVSPFSP